VQTAQMIQAINGKYRRITMPTLAEIRAKLVAQEQKTGGNFTTDNAIYPFWNIPENTTATLRFLPDGDAENTFFWQERQMIKIPFGGVKGQDEGRNVLVQVPCVEMWGKECPVHAEIRPWFKDPSLENEARKYWKKRSYIFQGFVVENPLKDDETPENPIRRFIINPSIYKIISAALMDPDFPEIPTDYENGTDFKLTKTQKGQYADYSTSNWARKERALNEFERTAVDTNGLHNLNDFMPKQPNDDEVKAIFEMFEASVAGDLYDPEKWGSYYTPAGMSKTGGDTKTVPTPESKSEPASTVEQPVVEEQTQAESTETEEATDGNKPSADQILAMIRERKNS
tara:strand:+ start:65 stop:1090 length:1026 start_codon:yes stop_codon:yes gene_type:complete